MSSAPLRTTALQFCPSGPRRQKLVDFGGWDMPVQYSGIIDVSNTTAVRNSVGIFDVSHMGEIEIRGKEAAQFTDFVTTNNVAKLSSARPITPACFTPTADSSTTSWSTE